jgi:hypothetical protein
MTFKLNHREVLLCEPQRDGASGWPAANHDDIGDCARARGRLDHAYQHVRLTACCRFPVA